MEILFILIIVIVVLFILAYNYNLNRKKNNKDRNEKKRRIQELQLQNRINADQTTKTRQLREEAKFLEDEGNFDYAILTYLKEIELAKECNFNFPRYSYSINRVVILYGKMKRYKELKEYLETLLKEYPESRDAKDWKIRLEKANNKITNQ